MTSIPVSSGVNEADRPVRSPETAARVHALLAEEATIDAEQPNIWQWYSSIEREQRPSQITRKQIISALDEIRGPWPEPDAHNYARI